MVLLENKYIFDDVSQISKKQAVLVLGASVYIRTAAPVLQQRLDKALEIYNQKKAEKFIVSGDHGQKYYDEVNTMREYLLKKGVPGKDIFMDHAGFSTYDSLYRARDVFGVKSLIIATQGFHLPRALFIAHELGIEAVGMKTDDALSFNIRLRNAVREPLARVKAVYDILLKPKPKYLGYEISINGDGRVTNDNINR